jgi:large subunit ribosomal protein L15
MQLNELKRRTPNKSEKRVGRGGKRGKTSGRGTKGQNARAGHKKRPEVREELKKIPKMRGRGVAGLLSIQVKPSVVNVGAFETAFKAGETINPKMLLERGLVRARKGATPAIKILGTGDITKKFVVSGCIMSKAAKEKIEKAGGSVS